MPTEDANMPATEGSEFNNQDSFARYTHSYLSEFIRSSDQKAGFMLTAGAVFLGFALQNDRQLHKLGICSSPSLLALVATFLGAGSALCSILTILPRQNGIGYGLIAWGGILKSGAAGQYNDAIKKLNKASRIAEYTNHSYELARVLNRKYALLKWAVLLLAFGGGFLIFSVLLQA